MRLKFKIAVNTLVQILGKIISSGCTLLITVLVARRFGVSGFGEFVKIITYVSLFYLIVDFGLNAVTLKEISKIKNQKSKTKITEKNSKIKDLLSKRHAEYSSASSPILKQVQNDNRLSSQTIFLNLLGLRVFFALILIFVTLAILVFLPFNPLTLEGFTPVSKLGIIVLIPTILTQAIFTSCNAVFQKNLRYDLSVLASSVASFVTLALVFLFLKINAPLLSVISSYLIGSAVMAIIGLYLSGYKLQATSYKLKLWRPLFLKSLPLGLTLVFNLIYFKADTLILTVFRPTEEVGIYGLARSFFEFPLAVPIFFMNTIYPVMVERNNQKNKQLNILIKKSLIFLLFSSLIVMLLSWLAAPYIVLIKPEFAASVFVFRILSLYLPIFFLSSLFMWTIIALGEQRVLVFVYGSVMLISLGLNFIFIPRFGFQAAVGILGLSELTVLGLTASFSQALLRKGATR